jgi:hypothetical protein
MNDPNVVCKPCNLSDGYVAKDCVVYFHYNFVAATR